MEKATDPVKDNLNEYGFGLWFRFLTVYPERLLNGLDKE